ncbi:MAG: glycogen synthase GlgA [Planctomycetes bacterium]|nr:glycogen synthase GlgA [Planctomycetota bacterium]
MRILFAGSEVTPFSKSGGLADVAQSLPDALHRLGHDVSVITPAHRSVFLTDHPIEPTGIPFDVPIGNKIVSGRLLRARSESGVPTYFVDQPEYFDRAELYREAGRDYDDNCERFTFFCRAVLESARLLGGHFDVVHANDWQCGLIPAYLRLEYAHTRGYESIASIFTIHNMAYQGTFWHWDMLLTGIDWRYFNWKQMEFYGQLNLLKTGLVFADRITTVSRRYAEEICESPLGCGLEGVLQHRKHVLHGILNGVNYDDWNPETDPRLARRYSIDDWASGKAENKRRLQEELGLPTLADVPLIGVIGRLADQKGWDLIADVIGRWASREDAQWVILGTGERAYVDLLGQLAAEYPGRIAARFAFSEPLAHRIEAGADMFLMPSRFEPCGLNQLYSLKYGTVPIVRATGGLADTITDAAPEHLEAGIANGFSFEPYDVASLDETLTRACGVYRTDRPSWRRLVEIGMRQDWSWDESASQYVQLYDEALAAKRVPASV